MGMMHTKASDTSSTDKTPAKRARESDNSTGESVVNPLWQRLLTPTSTLAEPGIAYPPIKPGETSRPVVQRLCRECESEQLDTLDTNGLQRKLMQGTPYDSYEQEADHVAERILCKAKGGDSRLGAPPSIPGQDTDADSSPLGFKRLTGPNPIQRLCAECTAEERLQPKNRNEPEKTLRLGFVSSVIHSPGTGTDVPSDIRSRTEPELGADLSDVRVHADSRAQQAAGDINAKAFTHSNHIFLGAGQSAGDLGLMAHELTHTVQQGATRPLTDSSSRPSATAEPISQEQMIQPSANSPKVQRWPELPSWDDVTETAGNAWNSTAAGGEALLDLGERGLNAAGEVVSSGVSMAKDVLIAQIERYAPGALAFFRNLKNFIQNKAVAGFNALFGGLSGRIRKDGIAGLLEFIFIDLIGGVWKGISSVLGASCSAMASVAEVVLDIGMKLGGEAVAAISEGAAAVAGFLSDLWDRYATPALDALGSFASGIWQEITETVGGWWEALEPVRNLAGEAWEWFVSVVMEGKWLLSDLMSDLFEALADEWEEIKAEILPYMTYVKVIIGLLLLISPMGPFIVAGAAAYGLYRLVSYLWQAFAQPLVSDVRRYLVDNILPEVMESLATLEGLIDEAKAWLSGLVDGLVVMGTALLGAIGALTLFDMIQQLFTGLSEAFHNFADTVKQKLNEVTETLKPLFSAAMDYLRPIFEFMRQSLLILAFGPFAILDDGVWETVQSLADFALSTPCIREISGLMQLPLIMRGAETFRSMLKSAWEIIKNPQPIIDALHDAIQPMVEAVPGLAAGIIAQALYPNEIRHRQGIERHLAPAIEHLQENWWEEIKKMLWTMLWPWDEVAEKVPHMIEKGTNAVNAFFELEISTAIDEFLAMIQDVNIILGAIWGWFAIAAVLIGGVLGALGVEFSAGATIGAGMAAGWALAETVGLVLLGAMVATELGIIGKSMFDLRFNNTQIEDPAAQLEENDKDYKAIANSTFSLAVVTALVVLGAAAQKLASAIWEIAKTRVPGVQAASDAVSSKVRGFLDEPRGRGSEHGSTPELSETPPARGTGDGEPTQSRGDAVPDDLAQTNEQLLREAANTENVRPVSDPQYSAKYDVEVRVGDHTYRRSRSTGQWCRFSRVICHLDLPEVNGLVDELMLDHPFGRNDPWVMEQHQRIKQISDASVRERFRTRLRIMEEEAAVGLRGNVSEQRVSEFAERAARFERELQRAMEWSPERQALMDNRPNFREGVVEEVWNNAKGPDGKVRDPHTGQELHWDPTRSRYDQWHMGHRPGHEYRKLVDQLVNGEITYESFLNEYNNVNNYWPEYPMENLSHKHEL